MKLLISLLLMVVLFPSLGTAQEDCVDYGEYLHWLGSAGISGDASDVVTRGDYAYISRYHFSGGVLIVNISDPQNPHQEQWYGPIGLIKSITLFGDYLLAVTPGGLTVIDISDPQNLETVGNVNIPGSGGGIAISGDHAFWISSNGLYVISISDPRNPVIVGNIETPGDGNKIAISETYAFVADSSNSLHVIDIIDPLNPQIVNSIEIPAMALGLAISGSNAHLVDQNNFLRVIDITDPPNAQIVGNLEFESAIYDVSAAGDFVYMTPFQVVDVSNPHIPQLLGRIPGVFGICSTISGSNAYIVEGSCYQCPTTFHVIDISYSQALQFPVTLEVSGGLGDLAVTGSHAIVGVDSTIQVIDISNFENPHISGWIEIQGDVRCLAISENKGYITSDSNGSGGLLSVIDLSDPNSAFLEGIFESPSSFDEIAIHDDIAFIGGTGLTAIDISNPQDLREVASVLVGTQISGVALSENYAYASNPVWGGGPSLLHVIEISDLQNLQIVTSIELNGFCTGVKVKADYAYISYSQWNNPDWGRIDIFDISNPEDPHLVSMFEVQGGVVDMVVSGDFAYVPNGGSLYVVNISDPEMPLVVGGAGGHNWPGHVTINGQNVFLTGNAGLTILPLQCDNTVGIFEDDSDPEPTDTPELLVSLSVHPNPFNPLTSISFSLDHPQNIELSIFDMTGKRIAVLANRSFGAGVHSLDWQGIDQQGRAVASGPYLLRMVTDERVTSEKMMLVR